LEGARAAQSRSNLFCGGNETLTVARAGPPSAQAVNHVQLDRNGLDFLIGEAGNDRMIWNPGAGSDTVEVDGGNASKTFTVTPAAPASVATASTPYRSS
jgi:hypothetical protein